MNTKIKTIQNRLNEIALKESYPFCYGCYKRAPSGKCISCGSDDLMRELAGEGVEYGLEWVIKSLVRENLTPVNVSEIFEDSIRDCYPETTCVGWIEVDTVTCLKSYDPVSWSLAESEWVDSEVSDGILITFDNGSTYYSMTDLEYYLDQ